MARKHGPFASTNPWRSIGISVCLALVVGTVMFGFVLLPMANRQSQPLWAAICTAFGIRSLETYKSPAPPEQFASSVAWNFAAVVAAGAGDPVRGEFVAVNCTACHGERGLSDANWIPSLAGMRREVIVKQLTDYQSGHRSFPIMNAIAKALSGPDVRDVAAYFATLPMPKRLEKGTLLSGGMGVHSSDAVVRLVYAGDPRRGIAPCASCHGLQGLKRAAPVLAGQHPVYLERELTEFRQAARHNDEGEQMRVLSARLTDVEITALAEFLSSGRRQ